MNWGRSVSVLEVNDMGFWATFPVDLFVPQRECTLGFIAGPVLELGGSDSTELMMGSSDHSSYDMMYLIIRW